MGSPKAAPPKATPPKTPPPKASTPNVGPPKACSSAAPQPPVSTIVSDPTPPAADQVYFGQVSITSFDDSAQMSISPDYQALTTTFANSVIEMVKGKGACDVTRSLSMTLPVTGPAQAGRLGFYVQGFRLRRAGRHCAADSAWQRPGQGQNLLRRLQRQLLSGAEVSRDPGSHLHGVGPVGGAPEPRHAGKRLSQHAQHRQRGHLIASQQDALPTARPGIPEGSAVPRLLRGLLTGVNA